MRRLLLPMALMIVMLLVGCTRRETPQTPTSEVKAPNPAQQTVSGQAVFSKNCMGCHGENGEKVAGWKEEVRELSVEQVQGVIRTGKDKMPSFKDKLSDEGISAVAAYAKDLAAR